MWICCNIVLGLEVGGLHVICYGVGFVLFFSVWVVGWIGLMLVVDLGLDGFGFRLVGIVCVGFACLDCCGLVMFELAVWSVLVFRVGGR